MEEAENQSSELFKYLRWLDPYIKKRQTTSNLLGNSEPTCLTYDESETRDDGSETFEIQYSDQSATPNSDTETSSNYSLTRDDMISETTGQLKYRKKKKTEDKKVDETELQIMKSMSARLEGKTSENTKREQDEDDMFCCLLATQLRKLDPHEKLMVKMQINNTVYNCLMKPVESMRPSTHPFTESQPASFSNITSPQQTRFKRPPAISAMQHSFYNTTGNAVTGNTQFNIPSNDDHEENQQYFAPGHFFNNNRPSS